MSKTQDTEKTVKKNEPTASELKQAHLSELFNLLARKDALTDELSDINQRLTGLRGVLGAFDQLKVGHSEATE